MRGKIAEIRHTRDFLYLQEPQAIAILRLLRGLAALLLALRSWSATSANRSRAVSEASLVWGVIDALTGVKGIGREAFEKVELENELRISGAGS
jgi:hypothetical protein